METSAYWYNQDVSLPSFTSFYVAERCGHFPAYYQESTFVSAAKSSPDERLFFRLDSAADVKLLLRITACWA